MTDLCAAAESKEEEREFRLLRQGYLEKTTGPGERRARRGRTAALREGAAARRGDGHPASSVLTASKLAERERGGGMLFI